MQIILLIIVMAFFTSCEDSSLGHVSVVGDKNITKFFRIGFNIGQGSFKYNFNIAGNIGGYVDSNTQIKIQIWDSIQSKILDTCQDAASKFVCFFKFDSSVVKTKSVYIKIVDSLGVNVYRDWVQIRIPQFDSVTKTSLGDSLYQIEMPFFRELASPLYYVNRFEGKFLSLSDNDSSNYALMIDSTKGYIRLSPVYLKERVDYLLFKKGVYISDEDNVKGVWKTNFSTGLYPF